MLEGRAQGRSRNGKRQPSVQTLQGKEDNNGIVKDGKHILK